MNGKIVFLCLIVFFVVFFGRIAAANIVSNKLIKYLYMNDSTHFNELRRSKLATTFIHKYNLRYIDLSKAMMEVNDKEVEACVNELENMKLTINQKSAIYSRCFYYYLSKEDYKKAKKYYQKNYDLDPDKYNPDMDRLYDIYINKGNKYLSEVLKKYDEANGESKASYAVLLSKIYENMKDAENSEKYAQIAANFIEELKAETQA